MITKKNICTNGCKIPPQKKQLMCKNDGTYTFGYYNYRFCPNCGALMSYTQNIICDFFKIYDIHPRLENAKKLILKSEFESAVRDSVVVLENCIREKAKLPNSHGKDLVSKSFSFTYDKTVQKVIKPPLIAINNLKTESERNEQEGLMMMLIGFFQGPRNLFQHNNVSISVNMMLSIIMQVSFYLYLVDNKHSILSKPYWIKEKILIKDILDNMPSKTDRRKYMRIIKRREKVYKSLKNKSI